MYSYAIGQCGIKPDEYWKLSEAETIGIIVGHQKLESYDAEKFRNIYDLMAKHFGVKGNIKTMWPLPTDYEQQVTKEYIDKRNADAMIIAENLGIFKAEC